MVPKLTTQIPGTRCRFEFCWECLADWNAITKGGKLNDNAHGLDCPFRTNGIPPTQISGENLEEAIRREIRLRGGGN
jgi:hypothetical protein